MGIQLRRGLEADLTASDLLVGEPAYSTDTKRLVIGNGEGADLIPTEVQLVEEVTEQVDTKSLAIEQHVEDEINAFKSEFADYIVEQGTSGIWTYRKWNSGISECWGIGVKTVNVTKAWGAVFTSGDTIPAVLEEYPTGLFVEEPVCTISARSTTGSFNYWLMTTAIIPNLVTHSLAMQVVRAESASNVVVRAYIRAKGRWK